MMFWILLTCRETGGEVLFDLELMPDHLAEANITYKDVIGSSCLSSGENLNISSFNVRD